MRGIVRGIAVSLFAVAVLGVLGAALSDAPTAPSEPANSVVRDDPPAGMIQWPPN